MILSVDPGGTTGVALWNTHVLEDPTFYEVPGGLLGFVDWMEENTDQHELSLIICESFIPRPGARSMQYDALWIGGYLQAGAHLRRISFKFQSPATAKSFSTNDKLKAAGFYPVGLGHAQDAARHLLVHVVSANPQGVVARRVAKGVLS